MAVKKAILVVDDSLVMRKVILRALKMADIEFDLALEAQDGFEALACLRANKVGLILCDINMPGMSGIELLRRIKQEGLAVGAPIVIVTTQGSEPQVLEAIANGASGYIRKPFTNKQMEDNMKSLLEYCKDDKEGSAESSCPCLK
jgi:two-component system chemotaxis response regulator CheY